MNVPSPDMNKLQRCMASHDHDLLNIHCTQVFIMDFQVCQIIYNTIADLSNKWWCKINVIVMSDLSLDVRCGYL